MCVCVCVCYAQPMHWFEMIFTCFGFVQMVFTDVKNRRLYTSTDEMQSHKNYSLPASSDDIRMHNGNSSWMLLYDYYQRKVQQLWVFEYDNLKM